MQDWNKYLAGVTNAGLVTTSSHRFGQGDREEFRTLAGLQKGLFLTAYSDNQALSRATLYFELNEWREDNFLKPFLTNLAVSTGGERICRVYCYTYRSRDLSQTVDLLERLSRNKANSPWRLNHNLWLLDPSEEQELARIKKGRKKEDPAEVKMEADSYITKINDRRISELPSKVIKMITPKLWSYF